ncbi:MAG: helix-turn-helix transcriptional regulator, partial [Pseudomonadota bacterium]
MSGSSLTGSRIRERRLALGVRQAALAKAAGISSSYLNLIEHNRRRIGGKLLLDLAAALDTEPALLSEGAEFALLTALGEAAERAPDDGPERARAEEFAGRFPGWAALVADQHARISGLEQQVSALSDRLTHDPFLSASLHEMLSSVTSIRSTASILAGDEEIEPQWQARFHGNLREDAVRLTDAAQRLVDYLDAPDTEAEPATTPQEELDAYLAARNFHLPELEAGEALDGQVGSPAAHALAERFADRYRAEAAAVPVAALEEALAAAQGDPLAAAQVL